MTNGSVLSYKSQRTVLYLLQNIRCAIRMMDIYIAFLLVDESFITF